MKNTELLEIKRMWKQEKLCCDRFAACYLDNMSGGYVMEESRPLMSIQEEQINRHLKMINKLITTDIGGKAMQVPMKQVQGILDEVRDCRLCNEEVMETFLGIIWNSLSCESNYEIVTYHAVYDIPNKGEDGLNQGESDDVYEYILCMICPTKMTKTTICVEDGKLGMTTPDRVLGAPVTGFIWPAFDDRTEDRDSMIIFNADPEKAVHGIYSELGCEEYRTTEELRKMLEHIFKDTIKTEELAGIALGKVTEKMGDLHPEAEITEVEFSLLLEKSGIEESYRHSLTGKYADGIAVYHPTAYQLMIPEYIKTVVSGNRGDRMRNLLIKAAAVIEDIQGPESELLRDLLTAADMQAGGQDA